MLELGLHKVQRFRGGLVAKAHRLCVSLNSGLESNKEEEEEEEEEEEDASWGVKQRIRKMLELGIHTVLWRSSPKQYLEL